MRRIKMSELIQQVNNSYKQEQGQEEQGQKIELSAFIDAEQSDIETAQIIDQLLSDSKFKDQYARTQLINDYLQEQVQENIPLDVLRKNISLALDDLPAHFSDDAVSLQSIKTEDVSQNSFFITHFLKNKWLSGLSVAASVMFVTLFTLQGLNSQSDTATKMSLAGGSDAFLINTANQKLSTPSLIQSPSALPATFVSTNNNQVMKQKYQWIEADPVLSRQVRDYINEHENRRASYNLQAKIRTATYQISE
jgi:negative regulator of sigma E activity